ncbi:hypothetical Protein YC6258_00253 [Gynuella sunshinyii YC6258]|uniref:Uncharacterized protein n=1 Tax=Gynuella sunshinyii YC6258 TaxID=1445510 RepID=A0A0C5UYF5_9GAMM|nr:hypothetical Protein YC6258_00253 [Gynuella sunshinyii YC6258]
MDYISDDNPDAAQRIKDDIEAKTAKIVYQCRFCKPEK